VWIDPNKNPNFLLTTSEQRLRRDLVLVQKEFTNSDQDDCRSKDEAKENFETSEGKMARSANEGY
jgi:hypothetical protein